MAEERYWPIFQAAPDRAISFAETDFGPCPVCHTEGGNCAGDGMFDHMIDFSMSKPPGPEATFRVQERVFTEQRQGSRVIRKLLYAVGDRITPKEAKKLGLM